MLESTIKKIFFLCILYLCFAIILWTVFLENRIFFNFYAADDKQVAEARKRI